MSKRQLIDDIRRFNTTVAPEFLNQFDETALEQYLQHLQDASSRKTSIAVRVRRQPHLRMAS
jgi:hypothetical protein